MKSSLSGWTIWTAKHGNSYFIKSVQRPIKVSDVEWYIGDVVIENDQEAFSRVIALNPDAFVKAEVALRNGNYHLTSRVISIDWKKGEFETENHTRYRF